MTDAAPSTNPSNPTPKRVTEATRIPMSLPQLKLQVPDLPGWHLHWFLGQNVARAQKAGYQFVKDDEIEVNNQDLAGDAAANGNSDMGSNISVFAGGLIDGTAEPQRLYLMKLPQAWRDKDVAALEAVNEKIAAAIRGGQPDPTRPGAPGETPIDRQMRYVKTGQELFYPKNRGR